MLIVPIIWHFAKCFALGYHYQLFPFFSIMQTGAQWSLNAHCIHKEKVTLTGDI